MIRIDLNKLRDTVPKRTVLTIQRKDDIARDRNGNCFKDEHGNNKQIPVLKFYVHTPSLTKSDFDMVKTWQMNLIGASNVREIWQEQSGVKWHIYLKFCEYEFLNMTEEDKDNYYTT